MSISEGIARNDSAAANNAGAEEIYKLLMKEPATPAARSASRDFLRDQLKQAARLPRELPPGPETLSAWMESKALAVGEHYARYLDSRKAGKARQYFTCKSHALAFLRGVAPTKLVDGAWLYGMLEHWKDQRFHFLIRTYLEELGDGDPAQNHVALYQRLLAEHECEVLPRFSDDHYLQGAIQVALAYNTEQFLPEAIGYNLGYEQLPLHLLITAFELNELGIDPYYFTLHVTIDNASTGHARKAVQSVLQCLPTTGDQDAFLSRVADGYRLNELGIGTLEVIHSFSLEDEVVAMLERKRVFGKSLHSDFCRIGGRTVNEWLATPGQCRNFLKSLEDIGWIKRNEKPQNSRFWRLLDGPKAPMAGVFSAYERQLLRDWIAGDTTTDSPTLVAVNGKLCRNRRGFYPHRTEPQDSEAQSPQENVSQEIKDLQRQLQQLSQPLRIQRLITLMAPASHSSPVGLYATRQFAALMRG